MFLLLFFEVMDKEPPIGLLWTVFGVLSLSGFLLACWKWPFSIPVLAFAATLTWFNWTEFHDPMIYPHILREDPRYLPQFYIAATLSILLPTVGALLCILGRPRPGEKNAI